MIAIAENVIKIWQTIAETPYKIWHRRTQALNACTANLGDGDVVSAPSSSIRDRKAQERRLGGAALIQWERAHEYELGDIGTEEGARGVLGTTSLKRGVDFPFHTLLTATPRNH